MPTFCPSSIAVEQARLTRETGELSSWAAPLVGKMAGGGQSVWLGQCSMTTCELHAPCRASKQSALLVYLDGKPGLQLAVAQ